MEEKQILCVGLVVLDIINVVDKYPEEDTDSRCLSQRWQRGGNASNSCTVLSLLGAPCAFMGSLAPGPVAHQVPRGPATYPPVPKLLSYCGSPGSLHPGSFVLDDLRHYSVDLRYTVFQTTGSIPISTVVISEATGSRTILHAYRFVHLSAPCQLPPLPSLNFQNRILLSEALMLRRLPTPVGGPGHL